MNFNNCLYLLSFSIIICVIERTLGQTTEEIRDLRNELFVRRGYDKYARPIPNKDQLRVYIKYSLIHVRGLDLKSQTLTTDGWLFYQWHDESLIWGFDPRFANIKSIRLPSDEIYTPDIMVYNGVDFRSKKKVNSNVVLSSTGLVIWVPPITTKAICHVDLTKWPYDEHICYLKFGSWTNDGFIMDVKSMNETTSVISDLFVNPEFNIEFLNVTNKDTIYPCCKEPYPSVTFYFKLQRKPCLYHYMISMPALVAIILSVVSFWFPIRSYLRFVLNGISLLTLTLLLLHLSEELGFSSLNTPIGVRFLSLTSLFIGIIQIWLTVAVNISLVKSAVPLRGVRFIKPVVQLSQIEESSDVNNSSETITCEEVVLLVDKIILIAFVTGMAINSYV